MARHLLNVAAAVAVGGLLVFAILFAIDRGRPFHEPVPAWVRIPVIVGFALALVCLVVAIVCRRESPRVAGATILFAAVHLLFAATSA